MTKEGAGDILLITKMQLHSNSETFHYFSPHTSKCKKNTEINNTYRRFKTLLSGALQGSEAQPFSICLLITYF